MRDAPMTCLRATGLQFLKIFHKSPLKIIDTTEPMYENGMAAASLHMEAT